MGLPAYHYLLLREGKEEGTSRRPPLKTPSGTYLHNEKRETRQKMLLKSELEEKLRSAFLERSHPILAVRDEIPRNYVIYVRPLHRLMKVPYVLRVKSARISSLFANDSPNDEQTGSTELVNGRFRRVLARSPGS